MPPHGIGGTDGVPLGGGDGIVGSHNGGNILLHGSGMTAELLAAVHTLGGHVGGGGGVRDFIADIPAEEPRPASGRELDDGNRGSKGVSSVGMRSGGKSVLPGVPCVEVLGPELAAAPATAVACPCMMKGKWLVPS